MLQRYKNLFILCKAINKEDNKAAYSFIMPNKQLLLTHPDCCEFKLYYDTLTMTVNKID